MISAITDALDRLDPALLERSGSVFYTGRAAFTRPAPLYILGLNPGGDPALQADQTVTKHIERFLNGASSWSEYADESWGGSPPGNSGIQPRMLHMLADLGLDPRRVPASNVIFARTRSEADLAADKESLIQTCWPVHKAVIDALGIRTIACFGGTAGGWVRQQVAADRLIDHFEERNARGWRSYVHRNSMDMMVITLTHPGRADWRNPAADPTPLVRRILAR